MNNRETENESKENINMTAEGKCLPKIETIAKLMGLFTTVHVAITYLGNLIYQNSCERLYGIQGKFFSTDIRPHIAYIVLSFVLLLLFMYPAYARTLEKKNRKEQKSVVTFYVILSVVMGAMLGIVNLIGMSKISLIQNLFMENNVGAIILRLIVLLCGVATISGLTLVTEMENLKLKKRSFCYKIWFLSVYLMLGTYIWQMTDTLTQNIDISNKTDYEFLLDADKHYVVLDDFGDDVLVVEYARDEELDTVTFYTQSYTFLPRNEYSYTYYTLSKPPIIKRAIKPEEDIAKSSQEG